MAKQKNFAAQAEQNLRDEAERMAKGTTSPGQTKEQTRMIARGIEKGIALYKKQEKEKARQRARVEKKFRRTKAAVAPPAEAERPERHYNLALLTAAGVFFAVALLHLLRYFTAARLIIADYTIPPIWSLPAAAGSAALGLWLLLSRNR